MIDTHCHLTDPRLLVQLEDVLERAAQAGVGRMITIGTDLADDQAAIALCAGRSNLRCAVGIHPNYVTEPDRDRVGQLADLRRDASVVAIGETGLDYHYDRAPRELQQALFRAQLAIAADCGLPVVIHCREAVEDALAILREFRGVKGVFHCFTGTPDEAVAIVEAGYYIGFTGPVTFKKKRQLARGGRAGSGRSAAHRDRRTVPVARADAQAKSISVSRPCNGSWTRCR